ncbi:MAG: EAL domain-containing protein [Rhizobiaceae bacterium]
MNDSLALPSLLADEIGLAYLRHGMLVARTAFEPLQPLRSSQTGPRFLRASTAWFLDGREIRQSALGEAVLSCGNHAFELACALAHMRNLFLEDPDTQLFVALPAMEADLLEPFLEALDSQRDAGDIEPDRIAVELTADADPAVAPALRARGHALCLGDFGGAGSSSALLETMAPDFVRLDARWVRMAGGIDPSRHLLSSLVSLLRDGGKTTLLAGLTTPDDRVAAGEIGVDLIAGPLLCPPYIAGTASPHRPAGILTDTIASFADNVVPMLAGGRSHHRN